MVTKGGDLKDCQREFGVLDGMMMIMRKKKGQLGMMVAKMVRNGSARGVVCQNISNFLKVHNDQPKRSPISISSSSSLGGGGGASFFSSFFFSSFLASFFSAATGAEVAAGASVATPPKLKKELICWPVRALAKSLGQYDSIFTPEAFTSLPILSPK